MRSTLHLLLVLTLLAQLFAPALALAKTDEPTKAGAVTADRLNLREGAGTSFAVVGSATKGESVTVLEEKDGWLRIRMEDGRTGWAAARYVEILAAAEAEEPSKEGDRQPKAEVAKAKPHESKGGGGSLVRGVLKWGCLFGAAACGGLAYNERSLGDDSYEQYRELVEEQGQTPAAAEFRRLEAVDHDDKAQTFMIAGGALFGAFLVQQIFFRGGSDDQAAVEPPPSSLVFSAAPRQLRAGFVLTRF